MKTIEDIKQLLAANRSSEVIAAVQQLAADPATGTATLAQAHYLAGNAHRQLGQLGQAMSSFLKASELDPDGPATMAYQATKQIMDYYCKDYYNP